MEFASFRSIRQTAHRDLSVVLSDNIDALLQERRNRERSKSFKDKMAQRVTNFSGSTLFLYLHIVWFLAWIALGAGMLGLPSFDPFPFSLLTMIVSLEAIFLSTFVLINQNQMMDISEERAELDLQIDLLSEHEMTKLLRLVTAMARAMKLQEANDPELDELMEDVSPTKILKAIEERRSADAGGVDTTQAPPAEP